MKDHGKLLSDHGIGVLHRPGDGGWVIVRADGSTMLSSDPSWTYEQVWAEIERMTQKKWQTEIVRLVE